MSKVGIHVNNKLFTIACDDGQESRVKQLGAYIDERFRELNQAGAAPNESYMLVLTSLVIADEMFEAKDQAEKARMAADQVAPQQPQGPTPQEVEAYVRSEFDVKVRELETALQNTRAQLAAAQSQLAQVPEAIDADAVRAEALAESRAKEQDIAKAVDALTDRLEGMVKKLRRA